MSRADAKGGIMKLVTIAQMKRAYRFLRKKYPTSHVVVRQELIHYTSGEEIVPLTLYVSTWGTPSHIYLKNFDEYLEWEANNA
jgi:malate/lactate dehydrogenase